MFTVIPFVVTTFSMKILHFSHHFHQSCYLFEVGTVCIKIVIKLLLKL